MAKSILVGDAGGSKCLWRLIEKDSMQQFQSDGFNYTTHNLTQFVKDIRTLELKPDRTYLYIAGADTPDQRETIAKEVGSVIGDTMVENDLLGAARSVLGKNAGYACILGTGSNAGYYDGSSVQKVSASLGYLLGDEGSGTYMGKKLLKAVLRDQLDMDITGAWKDFHRLSIADTIKRIYSEEKPNLYLASFAKFISAYRHHPQIYQLIYASFSDFFKEFLGNKSVELPIHFVGAIAFHFSDILRQVGTDLGFIIQHIVETPIAGLALYHRQNG